MAQAAQESIISTLLRDRADQFRRPLEFTFGTNYLAGNADHLFKRSRETAKLAREISIGTREGVLGAFRQGGA